MCEGCVRGTCACVSLCVMCLFASLKNARDKRVRNCENEQESGRKRNANKSKRRERERGRERLLVSTGSSELEQSYVNHEDTVHQTFY